MPLSRKRAGTAKCNRARYDYEQWSCHRPGRYAKGIWNPQEETAPRSAYIVPELEEGLSLKELMGRYEKQLLLAYQEKYKSGVKMAEALQTDQSTISRKLSRYHIRSD